MAKKKTPAPQNNKLDHLATIFEEAGCDTLLVNGTQLTGECPFCSKLKHFYIDESSMWICHSCQKKGNWNTFLEEVLKHHQMQNVNKKKIAELSKWRGIPSRTLNAANVVWDDYDRRYMIPYCGKNKPNSYRYVKSIGSKVLNPSELSLQIYGYELLANNTEDIPIYVCEGEWDTLKLRYYMGKAKRKGIVVGVPGAGIFKDEWGSVFEDRNVHLLYDNDKAGVDGMDRAEEVLSSHAMSVEKISWPSTTQDKYDVSDFIEAQEASKTDPKKGIHTLFQLLRPAFTRGRTPMPVIGRALSWNTLKREYSKWIDMSEDYEQAIKMCLATILAASVPGDPLWMFLVGVPSGGKTILLNSVAADRDFAIMQSTITRPTLISGVQTKDGKDCSLLPELLGKCLVVKDYTEVLGLSSNAQEELYSALRGIYDGRVDRRLYGGTVHREYKGFMSLLAGTTLEIHGQSRATLGERFLKYQLVASEKEDKSHARRALREMGRELQRDEELGVLVSNYIRQRWDKPTPAVPKWQENRLLPLASLVALLRTRISYNPYNQTFTYRPKPEATARLAKQFGKLSRFLAVVCDKNRIDMSIHALVERVALDTAYGFGLDILEVLLSHKKPMTPKEISTYVDMPDSNLYKALDEMRVLKMVRRAQGTLPPGVMGKRPYVWSPTKKLEKLWKDAAITQKSRDVLRRHRKDH